MIDFSTLEEVEEDEQELSGINFSELKEVSAEPEIKRLKEVAEEESEEDIPLAEDVGNAFTHWLEGKELDVRGAVNPVLKVASAIERWGKSFGIGDDKKDALEKLLEKLVEGGGMTFAKGIRMAAIGEGALQGALAYGEDKSAEEVRNVALGTTAAVAAGGLVLQGVFKAGAKAGKLIKNMNTSDIDLLAKQSGIKKTELDKLIDTVDEDILPLVVAEAGGKKTEPLLIQAIAESGNDVINKYMDRMTMRAESAFKSVGGDTIEETTKLAGKAYDNMVKNVKALDIKVDYDGSGFAKKLKDLEAVSFDDITSKKLKGLTETLNQKPIENLSDLLQMRREINGFSRGAKNSDQAFKLRELSSDIKTYIDRNVDTSVGEYIDTVNTMYRRNVKNNEVIDIFKKHSSKAGSGLSRSRATNWSALKDDLIDNDIVSEEADIMMTIAKGFDKRIGSLDADLFGSVRPEAGQDFISGFATTIKGRADQLLTKKMFNIMMEKFGIGSNLKQLKNMQHLINKSIAKSNNADELAKNIIDNKNTPKDMKSKIRSAIGELSEDLYGRSSPLVGQQKTLPSKPSRIVPEDKRTTRLQGLTETTRPPREAIDVEVIDAPQSRALESKETIDTDIVMRQDKKLTPKQAKASNEIVDKLNKNLEVIRNRKRGLKYLTKKKQIDAYETEIRKLEAENVSLKKKIPKI